MTEATSIREQLEAEFPKEALKSRKGRNGEFTYVPGPQYTRRLNDVFGVDGWSFEAGDPLVLHGDDGQVNTIVVVGKLAAGGSTRTNTGAVEVKRYKDGKGIINLADDIKAATTDALKRCCSLFGIGLYLYSDDFEPSHSGNGNGTSRGNGNGNGKASRKQIGLLKMLAEQQGMDLQELNATSMELYQKGYMFITSSQASELIGQMGG